MPDPALLTPWPASHPAPHPCGPRHSQPFKGAGAGVLGWGSGLTPSTNPPCSYRNCSASFWNTSETWLQATPQSSASLTSWFCEWKLGVIWDWGPS